jgi:hypothetical protein
MVSYEGKITEIPQSVEAFGGLRRPGRSDEVCRNRNSLKMFL